MGDLNAYTEEDPIQILRRRASPTSGRCSTRAATASCSTPCRDRSTTRCPPTSLTDKVTGLAHWNINAVESFAYQYDGDPALYAANPFRSSDHDPLVLGIDLEERCAGLLPTIRGTDGPDVLTGTTKPT